MIMMKCTEILMNEHREILKRMDVLKIDLGSGFPENMASIEKHCEFIAKYADEFHHAKEEEIYFKWIIQRQPPLEFGPINCMLGEHNTGRSHVAAAESAILAYKEGDQSCAATVKDSLLSFIELITSHIEKEDNVLYKMAESLNNQTGDGDEMMFGQFAAVAKKYQTDVASLL